MTSASVVIPVYNGSVFLGEQLNALVDQDYRGEWELLVVDNGSTDGSIEFVERWMDRLPLRILRCHERGVNEARNAGVRAALSDKLMFLDQDDVAGEGWLRAMNIALDEHRLVGGRLDYDRLNSPFVASTREKKLATNELPLHRGAPHAIGCNMGCQREVFNTIGYFDGALLPGADEMDFFFRAHRAGIQAAFVPEAVVAYRLRSSLREYRQQMFRYAVAHAQLDAKNRKAGEIPPQSTRSRLAAAWSHMKQLLAVQLLFSKLGRWRYTQRAANAAGAIVGFARYGQLVV